MRLAIASTSLSQKCAALGVRFKFNSTAKSVLADSGRVRGLATQDGEIAAEAVVTTPGSNTSDFVGKARVKLPVRSVRISPLTAPVVESSRAPQSTVVDETCRIAISRLGDHVRVGSMVGLSPSVFDVQESRRQILERAVCQLFPGVDLAQARLWLGSRSAPLHGIPIVGPTLLRVSSSTLATGHQAGVFVVDQRDSSPTSSADLS